MPETQSAAHVPRVTLYSQLDCSRCYAAREFLVSRGIPFETRDVFNDPRAFRQLMDLGSRSTPTITVDEQVLIGFDAERLSAMLGAQ